MRLMIGLSSLQGAFMTDNVTILCMAVGLLSLLFVGMVIGDPYYQKFKRRIRRRRRERQNAFK
jgi:hypothetical protein